MLSLTSFRLIISMILTSQFNAHKPCQSFRLVKSCTAIASSLFLNFISPTPPVTAASFQEQLAVVKALQLDEQKQTIKSEIKMQSSDGTIIRNSLNARPLDLFYCVCYTQTTPALKLYVDLYIFSIQTQLNILSGFQYVS